MIIYKLENIENGKIYIGQTKYPLKRRISQHTKSDKYPIGKALAKYGLDGFNISVIDSAESKDELDGKEIKWISYYNCMNPNGYNLCKGGGGISGHKSSPEAIAKRVAALMGNIPWNKGIKMPREIVEKQIAARIGMSPSEETREKIRIANTGHKPTPETLEKLRLSHLGHVPSEETRRKIGEKSKGNKHRQGLTLSPEAREKLSVALKGRVFSPETIERMRAAAKLRGISDETRAKINAANVNRPGHPISEESRAKISASNKGKERTEAMRLHNSIAQIKRFNPNMIEVNHALQTA